MTRALANPYYIGHKNRGMPKMIAMEIKIADNEFPGNQRNSGIAALDNLYAKIAASRHKLTVADFLG